MSLIERAIVTGASRGIGRELAIALTEQGAAVIGTGRDRAELERTLELCAPRLFTPAMLDVRDRHALFSLFDAHPDIDLCIVNAGVAHQRPFADIGVDDLRDIFAVNVEGALFTLQGAARVMRQRGSGRIAVIASDAAYRGIADMASYVASKHALLGLARSLQLDLAGTGVGLTIVYPGPVRTGILGKISAEGGGMDPREVALAVTSAVTQPSLRSCELRFHPGEAT